MVRGLLAYPLQMPGAYLTGIAKAIIILTMLTRVGRNGVGPAPAPGSSNIIFSLLLPVGISFGMMGRKGWIEAMKYAGAGRIMAAR